MEINDFFWHVENDTGLRGVDLQTGDNPEDDIVVIEDLKSGYKTRFLISTILENDWHTLRGLATGEINIAPLYHVTRIVGYYSRIENWNKSKLGELSDRRKGDYAVAAG